MKVKNWKKEESCLTMNFIKTHSFSKLTNPHQQVASFVNNFDSLALFLIWTLAINIEYQLLIVLKKIILLLIKMY